jgi:predicted acetyltransferase
MNQVCLGGLEIRTLGPADDIEAELDLRRRAFGPVSAGYQPRWLASTREAIAGGRAIGVFEGGRLVASARYDRNRQWWHGRSLPMAAVAGVKVAPEYRGRGVGTAMMAGLLAQIAAAGYPMSVLYPTTAPIYRAAGFEFGGGKYEVVLPAAALAALVPPAPQAGTGPELRRATAADGPAVVAVKGRVHQALRHCGPNTRDPDAPPVRYFLGDDDQFCYLADDGFLSYRWAHGTAELEVEELIAASPATARAFWQLLASHATMAERVRACLPPDDPIGWLTREPVTALRRRDNWMLRIVDAPAAVAGRGYPRAVELTLPLELADPALPGNAGSWTLEVSGGEGRLVPAGDPGDSATRLDARGFAALYAGVPMGTLRLAGLAAGGTPSLDEALDCTFPATAFMIDHF